MELEQEEQQQAELSKEFEAVRTLINHAIDGDLQLLEDSIQAMLAAGITSVSQLKEENAAVKGTIEENLGTIFKNLRTANERVVGLFRSYASFLTTNPKEETIVREIDAALKRFNGELTSKCKMLEVDLQANRLDKVIDGFQELKTDLESYKTVIKHVLSTIGKILTFRPGSAKETWQEYKGKLEKVADGLQNAKDLRDTAGKISRGELEKTDKAEEDLKKTADTHEETLRSFGKM